MKISYLELTPEHVGKTFIQAFGRGWAVSSFMGRILPTDVGKRVYLSGDILQVENDEQRARRLAEAPLLSAAAKNWQAAGNRRVENTPEVYQTRLERAAQHILKQAAELKGGYLISPECMAMLRTVLESKPERLLGSFGGTDTDPASIDVELAR